MTPEAPFISIVIPTCARNDLLAKCLDSLAPGKQRFPASGYEVIVTDDGRRETAQGMLGAGYSWARWVAGPKDGPAANRNNGASHARGEWIAFTDDDCLPDTGWLEAIARIACQGKVDVIEGKTIIPDKVDSPFLQGIENLSGDNFWSCNLAVRREVFARLGWCDQDFKEPADEDMEFAWRIRQRGFASCFAVDVLVLHPVRNLSWASIWKRTKMARWHELFFLKTNRAGPMDAPKWVIAAGVLRRTTMSLLRTSWHLVSRHDSTEWKTRWFWQIWRWVTFPFIAPYVLVWQFRFREMLASRSARGQS